MPPLNWLTENLRDPDNASLLVSVAALVISLVAMVTSNRTAKKMLRVEQARDEQANKQAAQAAVRAFVVETGRTVRYLRVENSGSGPADAISVRLDGTPLADHPVINDGGPEKTSLPPGSSVEYRLAPAYIGGPRVRSIRVEWSDGSGEPGVYEGPF